MPVATDPDPEAAWSTLGDTHMPPDGVWTTPTGEAEDYTCLDTVLSFADDVNNETVCFANELG